MAESPPSRVQGSSRRVLTCGDRALPLGERTLVVGVLNVTPDSFYDGGRYLDPDAAVVRARQMVEDGADVIDIGGQSSRPFSDPVSREEELDRVRPVLEQLDGTIDVPLSIDTSDVEVARVAVSHGACIINDISALTHDPDMLPLAAGEGAAVVLMHMRGSPKTMQAATRYDDLLVEVKAFLARRAEAVVAGGVRPESVVVDPGIGFGKSVEGNLALLAGLRNLGELGYPVLVGASRKSFIGRLSDLPEDDRLEGSLGAAAAAVLNGADILRVHDVRETVRMLQVVDAVRRGGDDRCLH